ncbi:MAG: alpha-glucan family phosphorylase [Syntrophorhabdales bacterium]|jgi:starch phosphorylase
MNERKRIAYFSMEIAVDPCVPTYSGGLGILAGDTIRAAADLSVPMVAVTLLYRKGYFNQVLDANGWQHEQPVQWAVEDLFTEMPVRVEGSIGCEFFSARAWQYDVTGVNGYKVPVLFLDADLPENSPYIRSLTDHLYGGDQRYRFSQEVLLGICGVRLLNTLGYTDIERFHMNEGHASLLVLELLDIEARKAGRVQPNVEDIQRVREQCIFTTHTPVPAGHDQFPLSLVAEVLQGNPDILGLHDTPCADVFNKIYGQGLEGFDMNCVDPGTVKLNMTYLALNLSRYVNGVAKEHGKTSSGMFAGYQIDAITNGVHAATWASPSFQKLYDEHIQGWRQDNFSLRAALSINGNKVWHAHMREKKKLIDYVNETTGAVMDPYVFTIGFARRATPYKRGDLLFTDIERLKAIASAVGRFQIVYAGKAHPHDDPGKEMIQRIVHLQESLKWSIPIVYLENYDFALGKMITAGVDLWLNTPEPPLEASGTSGMKAALNGVPSLSTMDGWWIEGHIEGVTGWGIGERPNGTSHTDRSRDADLLYDKLSKIIIPMFYTNRDAFIGVMRHAAALNGSFFNTHRMLQQYVLNAYF